MKALLLDTNVISELRKGTRCNPQVAAWRRLASIQAGRGFELMRDDTAGMSWLPAQALLYTTVREP